jgi:putative intracellular protease/amidase
MDTCSHNSKPLKAVLPADLDWKPFPAFPPEARLAVVVGRPAEAGLYVIRVKLPAGIRLMPHRHPEDRIARFKRDPAAQKVFANTATLADMRSDDFDAIFYPGGHGPMWDLVDNPVSIALIESFYNAGKPVAAVCHAPAVLHRVEIQGVPLVRGKRVTGFANSEEEEVGLTDVVPFLVEDELKRLGGRFEKGPKNWQPYAITDGRLVTGQNPASSTAGAEALLKLLNNTQASSAA